MARDEMGGIAEEGELFRTHIGGSALTEGVMMRGKLSWATAVRMPDGSIHLEEHELANPDAKASWKRLPIVRGCVAFVESMVLSFRAMFVAADKAYDDEGETFDSRVASGVASWGSRERVPGERAAALASGISLTETAPAPSVSAAPAVPPVPVTGASVADAPAHPDEEVVAMSSAQSSDGEGMPPLYMLGSPLVGTLLGIVLFVAVPVAVANLIVGSYTTDNSVLWNLVEAVLRVTILIVYMLALGRTHEMARVFGYHGAEHLTIHCFEHGLPLTPQNAAKFSRLHVRCGTAFLIMTMLVAIVVNTMVPVASLADSLGAEGIARAGIVLLSRLVLLPLVAGVSYEVTVRWAGSHPDNPLVRVVLWPGLKMQLITTRVPDEGMLECAVAALTCVRDREVAAGISAGESCCQ